LTALDGTEVAAAARAMRATYPRAAMHFLKSCLCERLKVFRPCGAFYLFLHVVDGDAAFATRFLEK
jgi:aspartate/methionine/tyrosine aminotransferase